MTGNRVCRHPEKGPPRLPKGLRHPLRLSPCVGAYPGQLSETGDYDTWCSTAVVVTNTTNSWVDIEVEWMRSHSGSFSLRPRTLSAHEIKVWTPSTASQVNNMPWVSGDYPGLLDFQGYALVTADDARIMVSAFQFCRSGLGYQTGATVLSQTNIPTFPVGATMEYFQAGMPATWTPPMAVPEVPE